MVRGGDGAAFHSASRIALGVALIIVPLVLFPVYQLSVFALRACRSGRSMPKDASRDEALPFPGEYGPNGFATQYINLGPLTNAVLTEHCKTFKLPHSGNKAALTQRLTSFSKDKERWTSLLPGATNAHKGSRKPEPEKRTKPKVSTLRRESLFHGADGVRVLNAPVTERSKDVRTAETRDTIMPWAKRIVEQYPYQKPDTDQADINASIYIRPPAVSSALQPQSASSNGATPPPQSSALDLLTAGLLALVQNNGNLCQLVSDLPIARAGTPPTSLPPSLPSIHPPPDSGSVHTSAIGNSSTVDITSTTAPSLDISGPSDDDADVRIRTLKLAAGKYITFSEADVPDPPATSYAWHIEDLLSDWDDNLPRWKGNSPLKINGVPIALIYWPTVFKYWKGTQWKGVKKTWFEWKILFHAMSTTTLDNFWDRYSVPDKAGRLQRMKYTPLLKELAKERQSENERLADLACRELTAEQLTYRKGGGRFIMTKPAMIAAHYRKLKGLVDVEDMDTNDDDT